MLRWLTAILLASTHPALAYTLLPCDGWQGQARNIPEPWEAHSRTFANGDIRIAVLDTIEPAAGAYYLLVLAPGVADEMEGRTCAVVGLESGAMGFAGIDMGGVSARYDPSVGLVIDLPVQLFDPQAAGFRDARLGVRINQAAGVIDPVLLAR